MAAPEHAFDSGTRRATIARRELGAEIRQARISHGLSQTIVARAVHVSKSQLSRIERGEAPRVSILVLARLLAVLGLELSARAYPAGQPIRDAAHRALLDRLRARLGPGVTWSYERPIARSGNRDQRAWDAAIEVGGKRFGIEAETRLGDIQALQRRIALKLRDDPATAHAILLLADTRRNRTVVRANLEALRSGFPVEAAAAVEALSSGLDPGGSSVVLV